MRYAILSIVVVIVLKALSGCQTVLDGITKLHIVTWRSPRIPVVAMSQQYIAGQLWQHDSRYGNSSLEL